MNDLLFDKKIEAGGGIVESIDRHQVLMIFRRGVWDFPKGKIEIGENPETAAQREVIEETGLSAIHICRFITHTAYTYKDGDSNILKITHWYAMLADPLQTFKPQIEEEITKVCWVSKIEVKHLLKTSFVSLQFLWKYYLDIYSQNR